ncbi:MAG: hypothetical protein JSS81_21210 [Acidobacteria bacterium]|nr:hypothetical protein [Acidobacteriota bacterium]
MKNIGRILMATVLLGAFLSNVFPCGPSYVSPLFEYEHAPEDPFANFAAGRIGVLVPTQRRIVLIAAYRYLNGGGFSQPEQKALVDVWNAEFNNREFETDDVGEAVKQWVEKRKEFVGKDEKLPEIYVEREYGGYDFFPNCTKNAFETATRTLSDRALSHGSDDRDLKNWVKGQDAVFENCASGKSMPEAPNEGMAEWLRKDRAYQIAAAEFYSLDYDSAKRRFAEIAQDATSPWQETAEYLVGRTLIRQASLSKDRMKAADLYAEAEQNLNLVSSKGGKYADSAGRLLGLVKYRIHPKERVRELAQSIALQGGENFRQDLVDYNWLLDKFEKEALETEERRKETEKQQKEPATPTPTPEATPNTEPPHDPGDLRIYVYSEDYNENWTFYVKPDATDEEALAKAEETVGKPLTDKMKDQVRAARKSAYAERYSQDRDSDYQGGYYGSEKMALALLPDYLRLDDLTNWLFAYQVGGNEAYLYSMSQWRQTGSEIWLLTAISKAEKSSADLDRLLDAAGRVDRSSPAYPTIAYHHARLLIERGQTPAARKMLDELLDSTLELPISSRNRFLKMRVMLSESLDDFLKYAQLKPFAFDLDGQSGTIEDFIKMEKSYYDPKYETKSREEYDKEVEDRFKTEKQWENRTMFDYETIELINQHFPVSLMIEAEKSPALPEYLRERFAVAVMTRALILNDLASLQKIAPEINKYHPEFKESLDRVLLAKTPLQRQREALYMILKNPVVSPFLEDGMGKSDNEFGSFDSNDWWCAPYDTTTDENTGEEIPAKPPAKPPFLSAAQTDAAQAERKKIKAIGDAPKYLGEKVLEWARLAPLDKRIPESLYVVYEANGWTKYGCGNNEELRNLAGDLLKRKYPQSEWTQKVLDEEKEQQ